MDLIMNNSKKKSKEKYKNTKQNWLLFSVLAFSLIGFFVFFGLNYSGYCLSEYRYISDNDLVQVEVKQIVENLGLKKNKSDEWLMVTKGQKNLFTYKTTEEFFLANPNCCHVSESLASANHGGGKRHLTLMEKITGDARGWVTVKYLVRSLNLAGEVVLSTEERNSLRTNCGKNGVIDPYS
jgi:hypothetical protein